MQVVGLQTAIWSNKLKTVYLLLLFPLFFFLVFYIGYFVIIFLSTKDFYYAYSQAIIESKELFYFILPVIFIIAFVSFLFHRRIIFSFSGAKPLTRKKNPTIYNIVENLCISRGLPTPKIGIIPDNSLNAFAIGRKPEKSRIVFSQGIINKLDKQEIEAVAAHELTHIINRDSLLMTVIVAIVGAVAGLGELLFRSGVRGLRNNRKTDARIKIGLILIGSILIILGYLIFPLVQLAISRKREFLADAGSVELTKNPQALISALQKISKDPVVETIDKPSVAAMCIENPLSKKRWFANLFRTHPTIEERINMLKKYAKL